MVSRGREETGNRSESGRAGKVEVVDHIYMEDTTIAN